VSPTDDFFRALADQEHALVMGVLNVTPDSFSDGGRYESVEAAVAAGRAMVEAGAAIVDVGGESTRPGADPVSPATEAERVVPVIEGLAGALVSVDTRHGPVARAALRAGACLVNDVSGGRDPDLLEATAAHEAGLVLMHMRGDPRTMQAEPRYDDVVAEVEAHLLECADTAMAAGVRRDSILLDPGIGFGKTLAHNVALLAATPRLAGHGFPLVLGVSRKSFLGALTGRPVDERDEATAAANALGAYAGAAVVRVHDVAAGLDAVRVAAAWRSALIE